MFKEVMNAMEVSEELVAATDDAVKTFVVEFLKENGVIADTEASIQELKNKINELGCKVVAESNGENSYVAIFNKDTGDLVALGTIQVDFDKLTLTGKSMKKEGIERLNKELKEREEKDKQ